MIELIDMKLAKIKIKKTMKFSSSYTVMYSIIQVTINS